MFYLNVFLIICIFLLLGLDKRISNKLYTFIPLAIMCIIIGLRYETGADLNNYELVFNWAQGGRFTDYEITYTGICLLFQTLHLKFQSVILFYSVLSFIFIYCGLINLKLNKLETIIFICFFYGIMFSTYFIIMRQFIAASIIFYTLSLGKRKTLQRYTLLVVAGLFHYGALVIIPAYYIISSPIFNKNWKRLIALVVVAVIGRSTLSLSFIRSLMSVFTRYEYYTEKVSFGTAADISIVLIAAVIIYVIYLIASIKSEQVTTLNENTSYAINIGCLLTFAIYFSTIFVGWFHRAYWYTYMYVALLPLLFENFLNKNDNKSKLYYCMTWILIAIVYVIYFYITMQNSDTNMLPYNFSLNLF